MPDIGKEPFVDWLLFGKPFSYWKELEEANNSLNKAVRHNLGVAAAQDNEIQRQRAVIEAQDKALAHWRKEADKDAGEIARLKTELKGHTDQSHIIKKQDEWIAKLEAFLQTCQDAMGFGSDLETFGKLVKERIESHPDRKKHLRQVLESFRVANLDENY